VLNLRLSAQSGEDRHISKGTVLSYSIKEGRTAIP
jgi:hypothetical protein